MTTTYLYAIGTTGSQQKVGYSTDPDRRMKKLQTGNPETLQVHYRFQIDPTRAKAFEKHFHIQYNHRRILGEWFDMTVDEVIGLMQHHEIMMETIQANL
jgi:hypothetical protein